MLKSVENAYILPTPAVITSTLPEHIPIFVIFVGRWVEMKVNK